MEEKFCRNICYRTAYRHIDNLCLFSRARIKTWMSVKSNNCFLGTNHHMPMLVCTNIDHGAYVSFVNTGIHIFQIYPGTGSHAFI